jgi:hypothetical protein
MKLSISIDTPLAVGHNKSLLDACVSIHKCRFDVSELKFQTLLETIGDTPDLFRFGCYTLDI